jgi:hypothetical protein
MRNIKECGISVANYDGSCLSWSWIDDTFSVKNDGGLDIWLKNPLKTADGKTVGQKNRELLHQRLDEFLDKKEWDY